MALAERRLVKSGTWICRQHSGEQAQRGHGARVVGWELLLWNGCRGPRGALPGTATPVGRQASQGIRLEPTHHGRVWLAGIYVAMLQLGGGVGSIVPENFGEYVVFFICLLLGSVLWAILVGTICGFTATGDPHEIGYRQVIAGSS